MKTQLSRGKRSSLENNRYRYLRGGEGGGGRGKSRRAMEGGEKKPDRTSVNVEQDEKPGRKKKH